MTSSTERRLLRVAAGYAAAVAISTSLFVGIPYLQFTIVSTISFPIAFRYFTPWWLISIESPALIGLLFETFFFALFLLLIPFLIVLAIQRVFRLQSRAYFMAAGAITGLVIAMKLHFGGADFLVSNLFASFIEPLCLGGALSGLAYWRIANRKPADTPPSSAESAVKSF